MCLAAVESEKLEIKFPINFLEQQHSALPTVFIMQQKYAAGPKAHLKNFMFAKVFDRLL